MSDTKLRMPKATALLRDGHKKVKKLISSYEKLEDGDDARREQLFQEIKKELSIHARIEEEIFYPAVAMAGREKAEKLIMEAEAEHQIVKTLLEQIAALEADDRTERDAKMIVLRDSVLHHVEVEEKKIFPIFEELDRDQKANVTEQLLSRKEQLEAQESEESGESEDPN